MASLAQQSTSQPARPCSMKFYGYGKATSTLRPRPWRPSLLLTSFSVATSASTNTTPLGSISERRLPWLKSSGCKTRALIRQEIRWIRRGDGASFGFFSSRKGQRLFDVQRDGSDHVTEAVSRAYALQRRRPLTLHATIKLPTLEEDPVDTIAISGFIRLVKLYHPFDDTFVGLWNKTRSGCSSAWLAMLQKQLVEALPTYLNSTESQAADLKTSQQWLRTMVWQLSIANGNLSSTSPDVSMTFQYPIDISRDLLAATGSLSQQSMEVHGVGLVRLGWASASGCGC